MDVLPNGRIFFLLQVANFWKNLLLKKSINTGDVQEKTFLLARLSRLKISSSIYPEPTYFHLLSKKKSCLIYCYELWKKSSRTNPLLPKKPYECI